MASLSDFGLGPEAPDSERRRARRHVFYEDESGARPLPREAYEPDPLDEPVNLPGVKQAGLFFGIGAGLGVAILAIGGALYFGGYLASPTLAPTPEASPVAPDPAREEAMNEEALAGARVALAKLSAPPVFAVPPAGESPDIEVVDEALAPHPVSPSATPTPEAPQAPARRSRSLSDELKSLERAVQPPEPPSLAEPPKAGDAPARPPVPPPAESTAPAEPSPPETQNPY